MWKNHTTKPRIFARRQPVQYFHIVFYVYKTLLCLPCIVMPSLQANDDNYKYSVWYVRNVKQKSQKAWLFPRGGGGTPPKYLYGYVVCAAQRGRDFGTPYLERGIHFRDVS